MSVSSLVVSLGEPAGIGPELTLRLWQERESRKTPAFAYMAPTELIKSRAESLGMDIPVHRFKIGREDLGQVFAKALPVIELDCHVLDEVGTLNSQNSKAVVEAIRLGVALCKSGLADALITNPIHKKALYDTGFDYPGHTEFLADLAIKEGGIAPRPVMMLAGPEIRTVPATLHIPLSKVPERLTQDLILDLIQITARDLISRFKLSSPRLVVAGLNPHAGEGGTIGHEDEEIIRPAVKAAQALGIQVEGPFPADTLFYAQRRKTYDVVIAMYHDQALIPVKTIAFDETVNVTLGLPFIRTSPDHGTALDIAGQNIARPDSLLAAIRMADFMARTRETDAQ